MSANDKQINGDHYRGAIQTWDYIVANDLGFLEGNIVKYVTRFRKKNGVQDLLKAQHYLQKLIEVENVRLCRPLSANEQTHQTTTGCVTETESRDGARVTRYAIDRDQIVRPLRSRPEEGFGWPNSIGDIT